METQRGATYQLRGVALFNGTQSMTDCSFRIGVHDRTSQIKKKNVYCYRIFKAGISKILEENIGEPTLFVAKFELSANENDDAVTVWQNPDLSTGSEPTGGISHHGANFIFDRISLSQQAKNLTTSWDEIRFGETFASVTTEE